jgi:arylsulfatase A-like enzyme
MKIPYSLLWLCASASAIAGTPNVLIFLADDLGQRDLHCYNEQTFYETPSIDRLAGQGVRFTDGYSANPVCSPTRFALMTGKWPTRVGLTNYLIGNRSERFKGAPLTVAIPGSETTLAEALHPAGYRNIFVGKWHLGEGEEYWPENQGFDVNIGGCSAGHPKSWFSPYGNPRLKDGPDGEYLTERLASETIARLREAKAGGKPFLLCHFFYQVHTPLKAPAELVAKYEAKAKRLGLKDEFAPEKQYFLPLKKPRQVRQNQSLPVYAAMVESMDHAAGRILAALDELGLADNTLVVFSSDNGGLSTSEGSPTSNLPFRGGKGWLYDGGIREPFIVRWPGVAAAGKTESTPVTTLDIFPTVLAAAGLPPAPVDGRDLAPLLRGGGFPERDLFWHYPHYGNQGGFPGGAIRSGEWKLVENYEDGSVALYHLGKDPGEKTDLAPTEGERVEKMREKLHAWYRVTGAKFLRKNGDGPEPWSP